jgi:hypothetical protein
MKLVDAFKELSEFYGMNVELITPSGKVEMLIESWAKELKSKKEDPNDYGVNVVEGIFYKTDTGKFGGKAYGIK